MIFLNCYFSRKLLDNTHLRFLILIFERTQVYKFFIRRVYVVPCSQHPRCGRRIARLATHLIILPGCGFQGYRFLILASLWNCRRPQRNRGWCYLYVCRKKKKNKTIYISSSFIDSKIHIEVSFCFLQTLLFKKRKVFWSQLLSISVNTHTKNSIKDV